MKTAGILLFEGVEELDALGPWEVLAHWTQQHPADGWTVRLIGRSTDPVTAAKGAVLTPQEVWPAELDLLVIPGGQGTRPLMGDPALLARIRDAAATGTVIASVCTGALLLASAGLLAGRPATTHRRALDELTRAEPTVLLRPEDRWVDDGDIITGAGISAGIDLALHLVERLAGRQRAREVRRDLQYDPQPPV